MKRLSDPAPRALGSIAIGETLPLREAARRMGWASRMTAEVQRLGLRTCTIGRMKYTSGAAVAEFVERLMQQAGDDGQKEPHGE